MERQEVERQKQEIIKAIKEIRDYLTSKDIYEIIKPMNIQKLRIAFRRKIRKDENKSKLYDYIVNYIVNYYDRHGKAPNMPIIRHIIKTYITDIPAKKKGELLNFHKELKKYLQELFIQDIRELKRKRRTKKHWN